MIGAGGGGAALRAVEERAAVIPPLAIGAVQILKGCQHRMENEIAKRVLADVLQSSAQLSWDCFGNLAAPWNRFGGLASPA